MLSDYMKMMEEHEKRIDEACDHYEQKIVGLSPEDQIAELKKYLRYHIDGSFSNFDAFNQATQEKIRLQEKIRSWCRFDDKVRDLIHEREQMQEEVNKVIEAKGGEEWLNSFIETDSNILHDRLVPYSDRGEKG